MELPRLRKTVEKVTKLSTDEVGMVKPVVIFRAKKKRKKKQGASQLAPFEQLASSCVDAGKAFASSLADGMDASNRKKKDGWIRDMGQNIFKATRKAGKKIRVNRMF